MKTLRLLAQLKRMGPPAESTITLVAPMTVVTIPSDVTNTTKLYHSTLSAIRTLQNTPLGTLSVDYIKDIHSDASILINNHFWNRVAPKIFIALTFLLLTTYVLIIRYAT